MYSAGGGFIMTTLDTTTEDLNNSVNGTRFAFATGFNANAFADASLVVYDTATQTARTLGTMPGSAQFGGSAVFSWVVGGPTDFVAGSGAVLAGGNVQGSDSRVFSAQAGVAGSLTYTTTKR